MKDFTRDFQRLAESTPEEAARIKEALKEELRAEFEADIARRDEAMERIDSDRWREQFLDQQVDESIDTLEQFAASLSPEARRTPSILMLEEMIRNLPPEMHEHIARRRAARGLPPLIGLPR